MAAVTITPLPVAPTRADPTNFATRGDAMMTALPTLATEITAAGVQISSDSATAATAATAATTQAGLATTNGAAQVTLATTQATNSASSAAASASSAASALTQANNAAASAASAAALAGAFVGTSTSSLTIGAGSKTFATQTGEQYTAGIYMTAVSAANSANFMYGQVTSYSGTTLILNVTATGGSGTFADWNLSLAGVQGATGATGPAGATFTGGTITSALNEAQGADIASGATINLTTATGNLVDVTGATTITAITLAQGARRVVRFTGALALTHGASLVLPGAASITTAAGDVAEFWGYAAGVVRCVGYMKASGAAVVTATATVTQMHVREEQASGALGGSSVGASISQTRVLNTVVTNTISGASLASNTVTLPAGTYDVFARAPARGAIQHKLLLYNVTDATYAKVGSTVGGNSSSDNDSVALGRFTIAASKDFTLRHYTSGAVASVGLGTGQVGSGQVEVFAEAQFWKVA